MIYAVYRYSLIMIFVALICLPHHICTPVGHGGINFSMILASRVAIHFFARPARYWWMGGARARTWATGEMENCLNLSSWKFEAFCILIRWNCQFGFVTVDLKELANTPPYCFSSAVSPSVSSLASFKTWAENCLFMRNLKWPKWDTKILANAVGAGVAMKSVLNDLLPPK